ncbi:hypothetical protein LIER_01735 [Lithospermum erythrorhizon]|uniref:Agenet domain-containing protein n=1 Tax=Lithospermum erythrorhizon TaxID=34254 RepID=A0AAV3NMF1_LITER
MPMDDNDNHYPGLSEDNSKITSVLHPHWLSKFDFDSTHTRFDSLVENEVFLAISSREDDTWIENFPQGNSGIVFSSSATESCSIPGRVDVWAEATSSESVELLLKSVLQEEMLPEESVIEEPDTCDELGTLAKQMELNSRLGGNRNGQDSNRELQLVQPSDDRILLNQFSGSIDINTNRVSLTKVESTEFGCSVVNLERSSLVLSEGNSQVQGSFDDSNESGTTINESLSYSMDVNLVLERQRTSDLFSHFVIKDAEFSDSQESSRDKPLENASTETENVEGMEEEKPQKNSSSVDNLSVSRKHVDIHSSVGEFSISADSNEEPTQNFEDLSSVPGKEESSLLTNVNNQDILPVGEYWQNSESFKLPESLETKHSTEKYEKSPRGYVGDLRVDKKAFGSSDGEVHGVDVDCEQLNHSPFSTSLRESATGLEESYPQSHTEVVQVASATTSEFKVPGAVPDLGKLITEDKFNLVNNLPILVDVSQSSQSVAEHNEADDLATEDQLNYVDNRPILADASQYTQSVAEDAIENRKEMNGATESHEDTVMSSASPGIVMPMEDAGSGKLNVLNQDTGNEKQDSGDEVSKSVILYNESAVRVSSFSLDEGVKGKVGLEHNSESQKPCSIGPAANVGHIDSNTASQEISHAAADEIVEPNEELNLHSEQSHSDKENTGTDVKSETQPPLEIENDTDTVSLAERVICRNVSAEELIIDASSPPLTETHDGNAMGEGAVVHSKEILGSSKKFDLDCVPCGSKVGEAEVAVTVAVAEHKGTKTESSYKGKLLEVSGGGNLGEADKQSHDTASVYRRSNLSELDGSKKEGHIDSEVGHVSAITCKAAEIPLKPKIDIAGDGSREEMNFSFDLPPVGRIPDGESGIDLQSFCSVKACKMSMGKKQSGSTPSGSQKDQRDAKEVSQVTIVVTEGNTASAGAKSTTDSKTSRRSTKSTNKNAKKANMVQPEGNRSCQLASHSGPGRILQFDVGSTESSGTKLAPTPSSTRNLPDLNTSFSTSALFHQPFSDLQQVQLRAQIFVYGSLIQGAAPEEACMVSAFGTSDSGRDVWDPKWRACVEKLHRQPVSNCSTPVQSRSGSKAQNKASKQSIPQSKAVPPLATLLSTKDTLSTPIRPMIPLSSPLWNLSAPSRDGLPSCNVVRGGAPQALPLIHPCQTPPTRTFGGQTTSWLSPAPVPGPWVSSSWNSAINFSAGLSSLPSTQTVKLTPLSGSFLAPSTSLKLASDTPISHGGVTNNLGLGSSKEMLTSSHVDNSAASKSRKRKKSKTTKESHQSSSSTTFTGSVPYPVTSHLSKEGPAGVCLGLISSLSTTTPLIDSQFSTSVARTTSPVVVVDPIHKGDIHMEKSAAHKGDLRPVEEAKLAGKVAVAHAADVVSRCQSIWSVLEEQQHSRLDPDTEAQLSSFAAALAVASSVAKAAAAAAKLASGAALHFHQLAAHALTGNGAPAQDGIENHSLNPITTAAGKAVRSKGEASLAAFEHAENLDAIVKAAKLANEAVSQAGRVVANRKPLPLSALIEAGPENYWRGDAQLVKRSVGKSDKRDIMNSKEMCGKPEEPSDLEGCPMVEGSPLSKDIVRDVEENIGLGEEAFSAASGRAVPDNTKAGRVASDCALEVNVPVQNAYGISLKDGSITENCTVEVFKDGGSFKGAWYSAKVLSLNDEKALVCYTDLQVDKESDPLREWVLLKGENKEVPIIRVAHPMSRVHLEGTRKRCRAALTEYHWSVGDRVDAWIGDCWREGDITEQNKNDTTIFTVHFPGDGETSIVKACHLRPTLTWKNGEWIELLSSRQSASSQGDTPNKKRLRPGSHIELKGKGEIQKDINNLESKVDYSKLLPLSSTEKFNIGSSGGENKVYAPRMMRSGLQKEGSKFFGVPRPGKKKKFMDVSKHYVSEGSTRNDVPTNSSKLSKFLKPRGTGLCGLKNSSGVDSKDKQAVEYKLKAPRAGKLPGLSTRTLPQKENSTPAVSGPRETISRRHTVKDPTSNDRKDSSWPNLISSGPVSNHEAGFNVPVSTQTLPSDRNKQVSQNIKSEQRMTLKLDVAGARMKQSVAKDKLIPDSSGTRRSNRTIQPTSRLLEGLQSSFITSKIPSASHNRSHRVQTRWA